MRKIVSRMRPPTAIKAASGASWPEDSFWNRINTFTKRKMRGMRRSAHFDGTELKSDQNLSLQRKKWECSRTLIWTWQSGRGFDQSWQKVCHLGNTVTVYVPPTNDVAGKPLGRCRMWKKSPATGSGDTDWWKWETSDGFFFKRTDLLTEWFQISVETLSQLLNVYSFALSPIENWRSKFGSTAAGCF